MLTEGQRASLITWESAEGEQVEARNNITLEFHDEYMGDHSEHWIIQKKDGVEVSRHNTRYIQSIIWEDAKEVKDV